MMKHWQFVSASAVGVAIIGGVLASHMSHPAVADAPPAASSPAQPNRFSVSAGALANMQLQFGTAEQRPLVQLVQATGIAGFNQQRLAQITSPARGRIEAIDTVVGQRVKAGDRLAVMDSFDLSGARSGVASAEAALAQAQASAITAQAALARATVLVKSGGMAQSDLDARRAAAASAQAELRTRQAELQQWTDVEQRLMPVTASSATNDADGGPSDSQGAIVAPFDGVVDAVNAAPGDIVDTSRQVFTVADLSSVWVQLQVPEIDLGAVQVGDTVNIQVGAYPGRNFTGRVSYIADQVDPNTGTVMVRCVVPNPDEALRVNMFANATIASPMGQNAVQVPDAALQDINGRKVVFTPDGNGNFTWHAVQPGLSSGGYTQILNGIASGTKVVTTGSYWLKATVLAQAIPDEG
jgi:cobalt-zinc-cadmium efflux system membrane fusion protein